MTHKEVNWKKMGSIYKEEECNTNTKDERKKKE